MSPLPHKPSPPAIQDLIRAFGSLSSPLQGSFIESFALRLSPDQVQLLETAIFNRGRHDILSNLPIELASLVLSNLDPLELIRIRRVSKSWFSLLTDDVVCGPCLRSNFPCDWNLWTQSNRNYAASLYFSKPSSFVLENATSREHSYNRWEPAEMGPTNLDPIYTFDLSALNPQILVWITRTRHECQLHGVLSHALWGETHQAESNILATIPNRQAVTGLLFANDAAATILMGTTGGVWYLYNVTKKELSRLPFPSPPNTTGVVSTSTGEFIMLCNNVTYCIDAKNKGIKEVGNGYSEVDGKGRTAKIHSMWSDPTNTSLYRMLAIREGYPHAKILLYEGDVVTRSLTLKAKIPLYGFSDTDRGKVWTKFIAGDRRNPQNIPLYYLLFNDTTKSRVPHVYWFDYKSESVLWHYSIHDKAHDGSITPLPTILESFSKDGDEASFNESPRLVIKTKLRTCHSVTLRGGSGNGDAEDATSAGKSMKFVTREVSQTCNRPTELLLTTMMKDAPRILMFGKDPDRPEEEMMGYEFRGVHDKDPAEEDDFEMEYA